MRMRSPFPPALARLRDGVFATVLELLRIAREALAIPAQVWLAVAELLGAGVLAVWRPAASAALAAYGLGRAAIRWAQDHVRPAYGVIAVCVGAAVALVASQFVDYRGISVGTPAYAEVEAVAPAPEVGREPAGGAHGWAPIPIAIAALVVTAIAARGRWRAARLLFPLGIAVVAISLAVDAPKGLDHGAATVAYEGVEAVLLEGFWAQLVAGAVLACCGPLLAAHLRPASDRAAARRQRRGQRPAGSRADAEPPMETETANSRSRRAPTRIGRRSPEGTSP
jgi:hypothetical protein